MKKHKTCPPKLKKTHKIPSVLTNVGEINLVKFLVNFYLDKKNTKLLSKLSENKKIHFLGKFYGCNILGWSKDTLGKVS